MTIVDTNYILRWFLNDLPDQAKIAEAVFTSSPAGDLYFDRLTIAETTYVLRGQGYNHQQICQLFQELQYYPSVQQLQPVEVAALALFNTTTLDFEDCFIIAYAKSLNAKVVSFDKNLLKEVSKP